MAQIKWNNIKREDIIEAINVFDSEQPDYLNPKGLFLIYNSKKYPAKTIRKIAYNIKNHTYIAEDQFKGGSYTVNFFNKLGFEMEFNETKYPTNTYNHPKNKTIKNTPTNNNEINTTTTKITKSSKSNKEKIKISTKKVLEQKNALQLLLNKLFDGDVVNERSFEWMKTPENPKETYPELYKAIKNYRGDDKFTKKDYKIPGCDFVSEDNKIIIEYDERQHFTEARRLSLLAYPDIPVFFDKNLWIEASRDIQAIDNTPYNRDETRAYYDSIRDIEAYNHGYKLIRIMHEEFDFESEEAYEYLEKLVKTNNLPIKISNANKKTVNKKESATLKKTPARQKNALQLLLNKIFHNDLVCEKAFNWMKTPKNPKKYSKLYNSLKKYNKGNISAKNDYRLHCDFVSESNKIIIEYDERAHFTEARRISLLNYPDVKLHYNKNEWIKLCKNIQAKNKSKYNSDTNRAYYDSIRDIEAYEHGYKLIRIKHGEYDFFSKNARKYLEKLIQEDSYEKNTITIPKTKNNIMRKPSRNQETSLLSDKSNINLKIGMYLQSERYKYHSDFKEKMKKITEENLDIIVFPEFCFTPFSTKVRREDFLTEKCSELIKKESLELSKKIGKAVVLSLEDKNESYFSIFANYYAKKDETKIARYIKNTMTGHSAFDLDNYEEQCINQFPIIKYKGYKLGLTICNDGNHAPFSRMYGLQQVDILLNSSGGDVKYKKWYTYHKARSIENNCFSLVTMGGYEDTKSYTYAFNPNGGMILPENLHKDEEVPQTTGEVYIYDLSTCDMNPHTEKYINQKETTNKYQTFYIPQGNINTVLSKAKPIKENIYKLKKDKNNIIFIIIKGYDILKPEIVIPQIYDKTLSKIRNKKYIIVNQFEEKLDEEFYKNYLSIILKTRTTENYVTVILESENINKCYQPTNNKDAQVIQAENGKYGIEIKRASGPEALWTNKRLMKKEWRKGFETVLENMIKLSKK